MRILAGLMLCAAAPLGAAPGAPEAKPLTPGAVGMLAGRAGDPETRERLAAGLRDHRPEVRAAAARVVDVNGETGLIEALQTALAAESDLAAAREVVRALSALGPPEQDRRLLEAAAKRPGLAAVAAEAVALARGPAAIPAHFLSLRGLKLEREEIVTFLLGASRRRIGPLGIAAEAALEAEDAEAWGAATRACEEAGVVLARGPLVAALAHRLAAIRGATLWYLAGVLGRRSAREPADLLAALEAGERMDVAEKQGLDEAFVQEMVARMLGRPARDNPAYAAHLGATTASRAVSSGGRWLTKAELEALQERLRRLGIRWPEPLKGGELPTGGRARLLGGLPAGLGAGVLEESGCSPEDPWMVVSQVAYDERGRPSKVTLIEGAGSVRCEKAAAALIAAGLPEARRPPDPLRVETVLIFLTGGRAVQLDERDLRDPDYAVAADLPEVQPPRRIAHVPPRYPPGLRKRGKEGRAALEIVVDHEGMPADFRLLGADEPEFAIAALRAVSRWRYQPATMGGRPVKVLLTVLVDFHLS